jgi:hypothetical protein
VRTPGRPNGEMNRLGDGNQRANRVTPPLPSWPGASA